MNTNNGSLRKMAHFELDGQFPLEKCIERIECLDEPKPLFPNALFQILFGKGFEYTRTAIARISQADDERVRYRIGRVHGLFPFKRWATFCELWVDLKPQATGTHAVISYTHWQSYNLLYLAAATLLSIGLAILLVPMVVVGFGLGGDMASAAAAFTVFGAVVQALWRLSNISRERDYLFSMIHQLFDVAYDPQTIRRANKG